MLQWGKVKKNSGGIERNGGGKSDVGLAVRGKEWGGRGGRRKERVVGSDRWKEGGWRGTEVGYK